MSRYAIPFEPTAASTVFKRNGVDLRVQANPRDRGPRWVVFSPEGCVGAGQTRAAAVDDAHRYLSTRPRTGSNILAEQEIRQLEREMARVVGVDGVQAVTMTADLRRIVNLPRHTIPSVGDLTAVWPGMRPYQTWVLMQAVEAARYPGRGLMLPAGVGQGKTLPLLLLWRAFGVPMESTRWFIKASLMDQWLDDVERYRAMGFPVPPLGVVQAQTFTHEFMGNLRWERALPPSVGLVCVDEASAFANAGTARTMRLVEKRKEDSQLRFVFASATFFKSELENVAHLAELALGAYSPLPTDFPTLRGIAAAVNADDAHTGRMHPGVLLDLPSSAPSDATDLTKARAAIRYQLSRRPGYVTPTTEMQTYGEATTPLTFRILRPEAPPEVENLIEYLRKNWARPETLDGELFTTPLEVHRAIREAAAGYQNLWVPRPPDAWKEPRKALARALRCASKQDRLRGWPGARRRPRTIGEWMQVFRRDEHLGLEVDLRLNDEEAPDWVPLVTLWEAWTRAPKYVAPSGRVSHAFPGAPPQPSKQQWRAVSGYLANVAAEWANALPSGEGGLVWTTSPNLGKMIARHIMAPYYGRLDDPDTAGDVRDETGARTVVLSVQVNHYGKNLQQFHHNLLTQTFGSADVMEQTVGRTHRSGQTHPVAFDVVCAVREAEDAFAAALRRSRFVAEVEGTRYKLWDHAGTLEFSAEVAQDAGLMEALEGEEP